LRKLSTSKSPSATEGWDPIVNAAAAPNVAPIVLLKKLLRLDDDSFRHVVVVVVLVLLTLGEKAETPGEESRSTDRTDIFILLDFAETINLLLVMASYVKRDV
jgi:hypothetical protein